MIPALIRARPGAVLLLIFSFSAFAVTALANLSLLLILLLSLALVRRNSLQLPRDPQLLLIAAIVVYIPLCALLAPEQAGTDSAEHWRKALHWLILCMFPLLALHMQRNHITPLTLLGVCAAGLCLDSIYMSIIEWDRLVQAVSVHSGGYDFGRPQIATGLYAGTCLFGLLVFLPRLHQVAHRHGGPWLTLGWLAAVAWMGFVLILTASRGAWLSLALALTLAGVFALLRVLCGRGLQHLSRRLLITALLCLTIIGALGASQYSLLHERLTREQDVIAQLFTGNWDTLPYTSIGIRAHLLQNGWDKWQQQPLTGWGPAETRAMIRQLDDEKLRDFAHFHNQYMELLVRIGLAGLLLFMGLVLLFLARLWRVWRQGQVDTDLGIFLLGSWLISLVWGLTSSRWTHADWMFYWLLLAGISYYCIRYGHKKPAAETGSAAG